MNAGLLIIILLLGLSFLGFPIYLALGIGFLSSAYALWKKDRDERR